MGWKSQLRHALQHLSAKIRDAAEASGTNTSHQPEAVHTATASSGWPGTVHQPSFSGAIDYAAKSFRDQQPPCSSTAPVLVHATSAVWRVVPAGADAVPDDADAADDAGDSEADSSPFQRLGSPTVCFADPVVTAAIAVLPAGSASPAWPPPSAVKQPLQEWMQRLPPIESRISSDRNGDVSPVHSAGGNSAAVVSRSAQASLPLIPPKCDLGRPDTSPERLAPPSAVADSATDQQEDAHRGDAAASRQEASQTTPCSSKADPSPSEAAKQEAAPEPPHTPPSQPQRAPQPLQLPQLQVRTQMVPQPQPDPAESPLEQLPASPSHLTSAPLPPTPFSHCESPQCRQPQQEQKPKARRRSVRQAPSRTARSRLRSAAACTAICAVAALLGFLAALGACGRSCMVAPSMTPLRQTQHPGCWQEQSNTQLSDGEVPETSLQQRSPCSIQHALRASQQQCPIDDGADGLAKQQASAACRSVCGAAAATVRLLRLITRPAMQVGALREAGRMLALEAAPAAVSLLGGSAVVLRSVHRPMRAGGGRTALLLHWALRRLWSLGGVARRYALAAVPAAVSACFMLWGLLLKAVELYQTSIDQVMAVYRWAEFVLLPLVADGAAATGRFLQALAVETVEAAGTALGALKTTSAGLAAAQQAAAAWNATSSVLLHDLTMSPVRAPPCWPLLFAAAVA